MPRVSRPDAKNTGLGHTDPENGVFIDYHHFGEKGGYVGFENYDKDFDPSPALAVCEGGVCPCHHWGYMIKGKADFIIEGSKETYIAGDAFFIPPNHTAFMYKGAEMVIFSETKEWEDLKSTVEAALSEL